MAITWECYKKPFKDQWIRVLKAETNQQISDTTIPGLYMRYSATTGRKVFYLGCRIRGTSTHRNILIGRYGDMNVEDIRTKATILRKQLTEGYDPMQELRERRIREREAAIKKRKVSDLLQEYIDKCAKLTKKPATVSTNIAQKRLYIDPVLGDMYVTELKLPILIDFYNDLSQKTSFSTANKVIWLISHFWKWCEKYEYLPLNSNPCARIEKKKNPKIKYTLLDIDGYKKLFKALDDGIEDSPYHPRFYKAIRIIALTGCRYSEISDLKRTEVALARVLKVYQTKYGICTVSGIIRRWAPSFENDTAAYVKSVCHQTGFGSGSELNLFDNDTMLALVKAIIQHENGQMPYTKEQLLEGIRCA